MAVKKNVQSRASVKGAKKSSSPSGGAKRQKAEKASAAVKEPAKKMTKKGERAGRKEEDERRDDLLAGDGLEDGSLDDDNDGREARFVDATPEDEAEAEAAEQEARDLDIEKVADELGDSGRILVRESGTEPVIRVMVEAESNEICQKYVDSVIDVIRAKGHIVA